MSGRDEAVEAIVRGLHDRGACRVHPYGPDKCDMTDCGAAWFLRQAVQAGVELGQNAKATREYESAMASELWLAQALSDAKAEGAREENEACEKLALAFQDPCDGALLAEDIRARRTP